MKMRIAAVVVGIAGIAACSGAGSSESTTTQGHNDGPSTDYADLSDYDLYPAALLIDGKYECARENNTWSGAVKSYYAGEQDGCLGASEDQDYAAGDAEYTNIANYSAEANVASGYVGYTSYLWLSSITTSGDTTGECYIYR